MREIMTFFDKNIRRASLIGLGCVLMTGCGQEPGLGPKALEIEAIAASVDGTLLWDPNESALLHLHSIGYSDDELEGVVWMQSGLPIPETVGVGSSLALSAGGEGCGYGGVTFTVTATIPGRGDTAWTTVRMDRYICPGSPWLELQ